MDRRSFFSFLATAPVAAVAAKEVAEVPAKEVTKAEETNYPVGYLLDVCERDYPYLNVPYHSHAYDYPTVVIRRKIYDGKRFVDYDSPEGAEVVNSLLAGRA